MNDLLFDKNKLKKKILTLNINKIFFVFINFIAMKFIFTFNGKKKI